MQTTDRLRQAEGRSPAGVEQRGLVALLHDFVVATADLAHNTARLAACEGRIILKRVAVRVGFFIAGLLVASTGLLLVLGGLAILLERAGVALWLTCVLVGAATITAGAICAMRSLRRLSDPDLAFQGTLAAIGDDVDALRRSREEQSR